jgi:hypothetical protein
MKSQTLAVLVCLALLALLTTSGCDILRPPGGNKGEKSATPPPTPGAGCKPDCEGRECGEDGCGGSCGGCEAPLSCRENHCWGSACDDGNKERWDGCTHGRISEFQVNSYTANVQAHPVATPLAGGGFLTAWNGDGKGDDNGIFGRSFHPDGKAAGPDFRINETTEGPQEYPRLSTLTNGTTVACWGGGPNEEELDVFCRILKPDGIPAGPEMRANDFIDFHQDRPGVAALPDGGYVVVWSSYGQISINHDVAGRIFSPAGQAVGDEFLVNSFTDNDQQGGVPLVLEDGTILVVWHSKPQDGSLYGVFARRLAQNGKPVGEEVKLNESTKGVQWMPDATPLKGGGFVVAWTGMGEGDSQGIFARQFNRDLSAEGPEFRVNKLTNADQWEPAIAALPDGGFVVAWEHWLTQHDEGEVYVQRYDATGKPSVTQGQINIETWDGQGDPDIAVQDDGTCLIVWYSFEQDGSERGIFGRRFDVNGKGLVH